MLKKGEGLVHEVGQVGLWGEGHLLRNPPSSYNFSCSSPTYSLCDAAEDKPGLSPHETLHTHLQLQAVPKTSSGAGPMPRSQPWAPGSSEGREAQRAPVFIYLFEGPALTQTGSVSLGAGRRGTLLPGPLMFEREMVRC